MPSPLRVPPFLISEGVADAVSCYRPAVEPPAAMPASWTDLVSSGTDSDRSLFYEGQRLVDYLLASLGPAQFIAYYQAARFTEDPTLFNLDFEDATGLDFAPVWDAANGAGSRAVVDPICPCRLAPLPADGTTVTLVHPDAPVYRPLAAADGASLLVAIGAATSPVLQDCARNEAALPLAGAPAGNLALVGVAAGHFMSFPYGGNDVVTATQGNCNSVATTAGINTAGNNGYVAVTSDATSNVITRLGAAQGWVRMDNQPFSDTPAGLFTSNHVFCPVSYDETGQAHHAIFVRTGTLANGIAGGPSCNNWTSLTDSGFVVAGNPDEGPIGWIASGGTGCTAPAQVFCMGITHRAEVSAGGVANGRRIWVAGTPFTPNPTITPDSLCQADRPAGVATAVAFISTSTRAAAASIVRTASYYRPDNAFVGTGDELLSITAFSLSPYLRTGIWQSGDGTYANLSSLGGLAWVGSTNPNTPGTLASTCGDWTNPTQGAGLFGNYESTTSEWWATYGDSGLCHLTLGVYCVQTTP